MPSAEELEQMLDVNGERSLAEFPDDESWAALKAEIESQHAPEDEGVEDGNRR